MIRKATLNKSDWEKYDGIPDLSQDQVYVFKVMADSYYHYIRFGYEAILSDAELEKSGRFLNRKDMERYIASRYSLRHILSGFVLHSPASIQFGTSGNKKPAVDGIEFNISHSGNLILIAVSRTAVGIDVELVVPDFDFSLLLDSSFSARERLGISSPFGFYELWTRKEALLKASGEGLTDGMNEFECLDSLVLRKGLDYELNSFRTDQQYVFSVAAEPGKHLCFIDFQAESTGLLSL